MIWIIASIPFWVVAGIFGIMGICGIVWGAVHASNIPQPEFDRGITGSVVALIASGVVALIAAKICS